MKYWVNAAVSRELQAIGNPPNVLKNLRLYFPFIFLPKYLDL